jgi:UDPglucose--hexose-1-phosphate uridylyltransferase
MRPYARLNDMIFDPANHPHRRYDLLADRWVLVSPHRAKRPWLGSEELASVPPSLTHDPSCYLCPGNRRAVDMRNPDYTGPYVFANDFPAILTDTPAQSGTTDPMFRTTHARGEARVVCYSPDHSKTLAQLDHDGITAVIDCWCSQTAELGRSYANVQIFENKGAMMGASNPHPHGQIWATDHVPDIVATEDRTQREWHRQNQSSMLLALVAREAGGQRSVVQTEHWVAIVPYWASWPFETLLLPRGPIARMTDLNQNQRDDLAMALTELLARYDGLFGCSFPYSMGWHGAPFIEGGLEHWQLHAHFYPPLLRSVAVRKFMVGYEMMAEAQRDLTPEQAAARLLAVGS